MITTSPGTLTGISADHSARVLTFGPSPKRTLSPTSTGNRRAGNDQQEAAYLTTAGLIHILRLLEVKKGVGKYSPSVGIRSALVVHGDRLIAELVIDWAFFVSKSKHQLTPR